MRGDLGIVAAVRALEVARVHGQPHRRAPRAPAVARALVAQLEAGRGLHRHQDVGHAVAGEEVQGADAGGIRVRVAGEEEGGQKQGHGGS